MNGGALEEHVDSETLVEYVEGRLSDEEVIRVDGHFGICDHCVEKVHRARNAAFFVEHLTARVHGVADGGAAIPPEGTSLADTGGTVIHIRDRSQEPLAQVPESLAATDEEGVVDEPLPQIRTIMSDGSMNWIDVTMKPSVSSSGALVIGLRIPHGLSQDAEEFELSLVAEGEVVGDPVDVSPGCEPVARFALPSELQERWRGIESWQVDSWPLCFILRPKQL